MVAVGAAMMSMESHADDNSTQIVTRPGMVKPGMVAGKKDAEIASSDHDDTGRR